MNKKTAIVLSGWLKLSESEKREFLEHLQDFERAGWQEKSNLRANISKVATGPVGMNCPCCGR